MAKNSIRDYSATASSNTDVQSVDISEGCPASGINNAIREVMADLADVADGTEGLTALTIQNSAGTSKYKLTISGTDLVLSYNGTNILKVETDGHLTSADDLTAFGTV
jgi:hypothetical protein